MDMVNRIDIEKTIKFFFYCLRKLGVFYEFMDEYCHIHSIDKADFIPKFSSDINAFFTMYGFTISSYGGVMCPRDIILHSSLSFRWKDTRQGSQFWSNIDSKLIIFKVKGMPYTSNSREYEVRLSKYTPYNG